MKGSRLEVVSSMRMLGGWGRLVLGASLRLLQETRWNRVRPSKSPVTDWLLSLGRVHAISSR